MKLVLALAAAGYIALLVSLPALAEVARSDVGTPRAVVASPRV